MTRGEDDPTLNLDRRPSMIAGELAREIKRLRKAAGISQRVLASMIGYSRQYVTLTEWEDSNLPSLEVVAAIDNALDANGALLALRAHANDDRQARRRTSVTSLATTDEPCKSLTANVFSPFDLESVPSSYVPEQRHAESVAWSDVEQVKEVTRLAATTENLHGGGSTNTIASQQLYSFAPLVRERPHPRRAGHYSKLSET
ncbi:helix-turn-helix domain-containing protein [Nocardia sp. NBC_01388]|uniref:helix-turn-helix domain-containing protein n=1 Tax=Nocardia sp. NBC_01388 TaxID=2903596 RepID=UPI003250C25A